MHVSFAAQLPPEPRPGEDPLGAHGPVGADGFPHPPGPFPASDGDPATQWAIPVIRDEADSDSGEFTVGAFTPSAWDRAPSPAAPTQSFPAGMFGQGAAAAQAAQAAAQAAQPPAAEHTPGDGGLSLTGQWTMPFTGPEGGEAVPWLPAHAPAADAAWSGVVDDPASPDTAAPHPDDPAAAAPHTLDAAALDPRPLAPASPEPGARSADAGTFFASAGQEVAYETAGERTEPPYGTTAGHPDLPEGGPGTGDLAGTEAGTGIPVGEDGAFPAAGADGYAPDGGDAYADDGDPESLSEEPDSEPEPEPEPTRSEHPLASDMLRVNGADRPVTDAWLGESLLYVLRERLGLAGAKDGCEQGECGACSVQVDGRLVASCLVPAATAAGSEVRTVEGLTVDGRPSDVQRALADCGAVQCGFCIPGMAMTVHDLLEGNHKPTDLDVRQALCGNLCRCSGYRGVLDAVRQVVSERATDDDTDGEDQIRVPHQGGPLLGGAV
jgi:aerobic-type carbon monoxide dehydrogenase small subunit (CoxS/CutS family)